MAAITTKIMPTVLIILFSSKNKPIPEKSKPMKNKYHPMLIFL
jgi:hypothetical protein